MRATDPAIVRWRIAAAMLLVLASYVLLAPSSAVPDTRWDIPYLDKVVHVAIFCVLGIVGAKSVPARVRHLVFLGLVAYGALTEGLQNYIPGRTSDLADLAANVTGAAIGVVLSRGRALFTRGKS